MHRRHRSSYLSDPDDLNRRLANSICEPYRNQVQAQHALERIEQGMENLGWIAATPNCRKSKQADKIVNTPLKVLDFAGSKIGLDFHIRQPWWTGKAVWCDVGGSRAGTPRAARKTDSGAGGPR